MQSLELSSSKPPYPGELPENQEANQPCPEVLPLSPNERVLLDIIVSIHEDRQPFREDFKRAIQDVADTCVDPDSKEAIESVGSFMEWQLFALPGEEVPEGIGFSGSTEISYMNPVTESMKRSAGVRISADRQVDLIRQEVYRNSFNTDRKIADAIEDIAKEQPTYQLLHSLATETPEPKDLPLTLAQRMLRESQIEEDVRRNHGLGREVLIRTNPGAYSDLSRQLYHLDDETAKRHKPEDDDSRRALVSFFIDCSNDLIVDNGDSFRIVGLFNEGGGPILATTTNGNDIDINGELRFILSNETRKLNGRGRIFEQATFLYNAARKLTNPYYNDTPSVEVLDLALGSFSYLDLMSRHWAGVRPDVLAYLYGVNIPIIETANIPESALFYNGLDIKPQVVPMASVENRQSEKTGMVLDYTKSAARHMILQSGFKPGLPEFTNECDLLFVADQDGPFWAEGVPINEQRHQPYIPGFKLVAHDNGKYYFRQSGIDPYNGSAFVDVALDRVNQLADECERIGYSHLANRLKSKNNWSLHDVETAIKETSDYTFDDQWNIINSDDDHEVDFTDFAQLTSEEGRLQVQCTGAAAFFKLSSQILFPDNNSVILGPGYSIEPYGYIGGNTHVQVLLNLHGEQYVVDSTPSRLTGEASLEAKDRDEIQARSEREKPVLEDKADNTANIISDTETKRRDDANGQLANLPSRLNSLLKAHFKLPNGEHSDNEMYKRVVGLKKSADPIRKTMSLFKRSQSGHDVAAEIDETIAYIDRLIGADRNTIRRLGIPKYSPVLLGSLRDIVATLSLRSID